MKCERAAPGDLRVMPGMLFVTRRGAPAPDRIVFLVQQCDGDDWREVARFADAGDASAEAARLRRIRAAIRSGDPN